ncbi:MAG: MYXO-CTERM sorting domain-containing protein [Polyangia bacterium]
MKLLALSVPILALAPHVARACSPPQCVPGYVLPKDGALLPAAPPALVIHASTSASMNGDPHLTKEGVDVAFTLVPDKATSDVLVVPAAPLEAGTYAFSRSEDCNNSSSTSALTLQTSTFTVGAVVVQPQTLGTASVVVSDGMVTASTASGSCTVTYPASVAKLSLVPSAEVSSWQPLVQYTLEVDGAVWAKSEYGSTVGSSSSGRTVSSVFARCDRPDGSSADDNGLAEGPHHAVLSGHVAGATTDPTPIELDFQLACGGVPFEDGGVVVTPQVKSSGCSFGGNSAKAPWLLLPLLALVLVRRRRDA